MTTTQPTPAQADSHDVRRKLDAAHSVAAAEMILLHREQQETTRLREALAQAETERDAAQARYETVADAIVETHGQPPNYQKEGLDAPEHEALACWVRNQFDD